ncbi:MAG: hypothetical protein E7158_05535 [Firmicutes bacterium]|nr:hypothetical protein [Bacillota bacterium]
MAKNKLSKSQIKKLKTNITKYAKDISNTSNQLVKTIEEMNASIYYGGDAANEWYKKADASVTSNVNFLKRLEQTLAKIDNLIKNAERVTGGASNSTVGSTAVAGAGAGIGAGAGAAMSNNQGSGTGNTGGVGGTQPTNPAGSSNNKSYGHNDYTPGSNSNNNKSYGHNDYTPGTSNSNSNNNSASSKTYGHNDYTPGSYENPLAGSMRTPGADYQKNTPFGTTTPKKRGLFD